MSAVADSLAQIQQGYVQGSDRPACGNCGGCQARAGWCGLGAFPVEAGGWCPLWMPSVRWGQTHRDTMALMGLNMGEGLGSQETGLPGRAA